MELKKEQIDKGRELLQCWIGSWNVSYWNRFLNAVAPHLQYAPTTGALTQEQIVGSILYRLNEHLLEMKPGYDDSITGFNEAQDVVRDVLKNPIRAVRRPAEPQPAAEPIPAPFDKTDEWEARQDVNKPSPADAHCPHCGSNERGVRKEVYSDSSHRDFRECGDQWHNQADAQGDLVERASNAYLRESNAYSAEHKGKDDHSFDPLEAHRRAIVAALAVAQAHPPAGWVSVEAVKQAIIYELGDADYSINDFPLAFAGYVVARLSPAKLKDRVTVVGAMVFLDGEEYACFRGHDSHGPAELYAAELRAKLEKQ